MPTAGLRADDRAHGVVEGQAEHLHVEVDGVAGQATFGPAPVGVFDEQSFVRLDLEVAAAAFPQDQSALFQQRRQLGQPGSADLFARPAGFFKGGIGHGLFASGVGAGRG